jgi:tellurite resistance protein TehA-like permease
MKRFLIHLLVYSLAYFIFELFRKNPRFEQPLFYISYAMGAFFYLMIIYLFFTNSEKKPPTNLL